MDVWTVMIVLHATSAGLCFFAGLAAISPSRARRDPVLVHTFVWLLAGMLVFVAAALASHWTEITTVEQVVFPGLVVLGAYMLNRGLRARRLLDRDDRLDDYVGDVGFVLIALFNGFIIVALIDRGVGWLAPVGAVAAIVVGHKLRDGVKRRVKPEPVGS